MKRTKERTPDSPPSCFTCHDSQRTPTYCESFFARSPHVPTRDGRFFECVATRFFFRGRGATAVAVEAEAEGQVGQVAVAAEVDAVANAEEEA